MAVESDADRRAYLADFGVQVTWTHDGAPATLTAIFDRPSLVVDGLSETGLIDRAATILCIEVDLPAGAAEGDAVTVAGVAQGYVCQAVRPDGQGFAAVDLRRAT